MEGVHSNNNRLEQLVDQLYGRNRRLLTFEGKMLRMAERCGVDRQDFLDHYFGRELDPRWVSRVKRLAGKGWSRFADRYGDDVKGIRKERSEEHTSELQSLMRISYAVFCLQKKQKQNKGRATTT